MKGLTNEDNNEDTLQNLRDFLMYLEEKNIINGRQLEDKKEVNNLIEDLMKLDLFNNVKGDKGANLILSMP